MTTGIARDLSAKLQGQIAAVLERELHIFQHVLDPDELAAVMLEAAVMTVRTTAATLAGYATTPADIEAVFRATTNAIVQQVRSGEDEGIIRTIASMATRR